MKLTEPALHRKLRTLSQLRGTRAVFEGRDLVLFCGNDYLGLSQDARLGEAMRLAIERYGVGAGAARLISGTSEVHTELEHALAKFKGKEQALLFGAGYLANVGVLGTLAGEDDLIVMDKLCHASLIDGARLAGARVRVFPHKNYGRCEEILEQSPRDEFTARPYRRRILVSETVFSMDGDLADLDELTRLKKKYDCLLVLDDAHGIGVFGEEGEGYVSRDQAQEIDVITGTLSKALGVYGGFVAASHEIIEELIQGSRTFLFATAPPPALAAAALEALQLVRTEPELRERLWRHIQLIREFLERHGRTPAAGAIFPLLIGDEKEALVKSERLLERGILIPAIRYPTVARRRARLRLTVSAAHRDEDLKKLFESLSEILE